MNEQAKSPAPQAIADAFSAAEAKIAEAMDAVLTLGRVTDRYAAANGITPFQSAPMRKDYGDAAKGLGDALSAVTDMHRKAAPFNPEIAAKNGDNK